MKSHRGFLLPAALFLLVVLSLGAAFIVVLATLTREANMQYIQTNRAFDAAKSALDWAIYKALNTGVCPTVPTTITFTQGGLTAFTATVTSCTSNSYTEGVSTYTIFKMHATGQRGTQGTTDYVTREWEVIVSTAP